MALALSWPGLVQAGVGTWTTGGPYGGTTRAVAIDPATPTTVYASVQGGRVFKSIDAGATWAPSGVGLTSTMGLPVLDVFSLAIQSTNPAVLYAGTDGNGVFKSTNAGATWAPVNPGMVQTSVNTLAIDPVTPSTLYAGTDPDGVFKSVDSGATWVPVNAGLTDRALRVYALAVDRTTPATLYAGTQSGVFKSTNAGSSWSPANNGLFYPDVWTLVIDPVTSSTLYAGSSGGGVFKSVDAGASWILASTGLDAQPDLNLRSLAIHPTTPSILYAGTLGGIYKSIDAGAHWASANTGLTNGFAFTLAINPTSPATLYAGLSGSAISKSTNSAGTWAPASTGINYLSVSDLLVDPSSPATLYAGTPAGVLKSTNGGGAWVPATNGLTLPSNRGVPSEALAIDPTNSAILYSSGSGVGVFKSTNGAASWNAINSGLPNPPYVRALALDPIAPSNLYVGMLGMQLYKSINAGASWTPAQSGLPSGDQSSFVRALAVDPSDSNVVFAGTSDKGLFKSSNGGAAWAPASTGLPTTDIFSIAVDPVTHSIVYAATRSGLYKSTNSGGTWSSAGLSDFIVTDVALLPSAPSTLYASTSLGVFESNDSGANWAAVNKGLTNLAVNALALDPSGATTLYAGAPNGAWQASLPTGLESDLAIDLTATPNPVSGTAELTYFIHVTNAGPGTAPALRMVQTLPAAVTFELAFGSGWTCGESGGTLTCTRPGPNVGAVPGIAVGVRPSPAGAIAVSTATVSSAEADPNLGDNTDSVSTTVNQAVVFFGTRTMTVVAPSGHFAAGAAVTYTALITNTGPQAQPDWGGHEFQDVLPASLSLVSATATSGTLLLDFGTNTVNWDGTIPSGGSVTFTIQATIKPTTDAGTQIQNQGIIYYDADGTAGNEAYIQTDDPGVSGLNDPTSFVVIIPPASLYTVPPCRLLDTRNPAGPFGGPSLAANVERTFSLFNRCNIPATAKALSVNMTVTQPTAAGNLRLYPGGTSLPSASAINYGPGQTRANNAVVPLNSLGALAVFCSQAAGTSDFILDVNGYFQ